MGGIGGSAVGQWVILAGAVATLGAGKILGLPDWWYAVGAVGSLFLAAAVEDWV